MRRKVAVEINVEAETDAQAEVAVQITLQAAGLPGECFRIWGAVMTSEQIECCRRIGRNEASRTAVIGLAELDALCDTAHGVGRWHGEPLRPEDFERVIEASREVDAGKLADVQAERLALLSEALSEGDIAVRADYEGFLREMKAADLIGDYKMTGSDTALVRLKQPLRHVKIKRWVQE